MSKGSDGKDSHGLDSRWELLVLMTSGVCALNSYLALSCGCVIGRRMGVQKKVSDQISFHCFLVVFLEAHSQQVHISLA